MNSITKEINDFLKVSLILCLVIVPTSFQCWEPEELNLNLLVIKNCTDEIVPIVEENLLLSNELVRDTTYLESGKTIRVNQKTVPLDGHFDETKAFPAMNEKTLVFRKINRDGTSEKLSGVFDLSSYRLQIFESNEKWPEEYKDYWSYYPENLRNEFHLYTYEIHE